MNKTVLIYSCVLLIGVLVSAISQVLLKKAAMKHYENHLKEYLNPMVIFAYAMFVGTTFLSIIAYRGIPLSMGPILEATSYIYVTIFGVKIFHERLNKKKIINIFISVIIILCISVWGFERYRINQLIDEAKHTKMKTYTAEEYKEKIAKEKQEK